MTRRYKPVHNARKTIIQVAITVAAVLVIVFSPFFMWALGPAHVLARPFWWVSSTFSDSAKNTVAVTQSKKSLVNDLNTLREEVVRLQTVDAENRFLKDENAELQQLLGSAPKNLSGVLARVLVRPPQSWYDALVLDKGSDDAIAIGDTAYAYGTIPVGKVVAVSDSSSTVELYSASNRPTDAILIPGNVPVAVTGTGNASFQFDVHRDIAVDQQSVIILPTGQLLGTVQSVEFDTRDPYRSVRAVSAVNVQNLRFVTIVK